MLQAGFRCCYASAISFRNVSTATRLLRTTKRFVRDESARMTVLSHLAQAVVQGL